MTVKGQKLDVSPKYLHLAKVTIKPFHQFPVDMLRYDRCCPHQEVDSGLIGESGMNKNGLTVIVQAYTTVATPTWTVQRWQSFGAEIEPIASADVPQARTQGAAAGV